MLCALLAVGLADGRALLQSGVGGESGPIWVFAHTPFSVACDAQALSAAHHGFRQHSVCTLVLRAVGFSTAGVILALLPMWRSYDCA